jgi:hypothetical protein
LNKSSRRTSSTPPGPLRRDAERSRQQILLAARTAFAERGLTVTLDEIAQRAGVGVGTVYRPVGPIGQRTGRGRSRSGTSTPRRVMSRLGILAAVYHYAEE